MQAKLKKMNEARVLKAIEKKLPQLGDKGSVVDYQKGAYDAKAALEAAAQAEEDGSEEQPNKRTKTDHPTDETNAADMAAYYAQYGYTYDPNAAYYYGTYSYDNSAFIYTEEPSAVPEKPAANENALAGLAAYGSDDEA